MDNLQQYFKTHQDAVSRSDEDIPKGDDARFEERWDVYRHRIKFQSSLKRRKKPLWKVVAFPLVASVVLIVGVWLMFKPIAVNQEQKMFSSAIDSLTPAQVYEGYRSLMLQRVDEIYNLSATLNDDPDDILITLDVIMRESVPLIDQLPDEMSDEDKIEVLREYSERKIEALDTYRNRLVYSSKQ